MKWKFQFNDLLDRYTHSGIGNVKVSYFGDGFVWLSIENKVVCYQICTTQEEAHRQAKKMYLEFIANKLSKRHVLVKVSARYAIYDIYDGTYMTFTKRVLHNLERIIK